MAYVSVTGGKEAIAQANLLSELARWRTEGARLNPQDITGQLAALVDRVMSEGGMYGPDYAALAVKQAQGDPLEAGFLIRAYRSTLPRHHYSNVIDTKGMRVQRRISSAFKDIPGGQMLGSTNDYAHRLLDFGLRDESLDRRSELLSAVTNKNEDTSSAESAVWPSFPKVADLLRQEGLLASAPEADGGKPYDVTREKLTFPVPRSGQLQILARGETGAMMALAYSSMRGFGSVHPTIGELRVGHVGLTVQHPFRPGDEPLYVGEIIVTEVETINSFARAEAGGRGEIQFEMGYGLCFGQNEVKAIAMAILERCISACGSAPAQDQEFVLTHIDSVEASGFVSHLKLPHYVTFQSALARIRNARGIQAAALGVK